MKSKSKDQLQTLLICLGIGIVLYVAGIWLEKAGIYIFIIGFPLAGTLPIIGGIFVIIGLLILIDYVNQGYIIPFRKKRNFKKYNRKSD